MANEKKREELKVVIVEFRVSMHCNACERTMAKIISKFKGVETFTADMDKHKGGANKREEEGSKDTGENVASVAIPQPINGHCPPIFYYNFFTII
ncbi:hypothetical protein Peur_041837 [Populus x canadensis]